jgi:hypothetical protein
VRADRLGGRAAGVAAGEERLDAVLGGHGAIIAPRGPS